MLELAIEEIVNVVLVVVLIGAFMFIIHMCGKTEEHPGKDKDLHKGHNGSKA